jgi:hypothetical protein
MSDFRMLRCPDIRIFGLLGTEHARCMLACTKDSFTGSYLNYLYYICAHVLKK